MQVAVGILLAAGLKDGTLSESVGVAIIVMFCLFALGFAWCASICCSCSVYTGDQLKEEWLI